jgi:tricorn protease-like protein
MAAAAREHAQALVQNVATKKEKVKVEKIKEYKEPLMIDTSSYREEQKASLKKMLDFLSDDIYGRGT